MKQKRILFLLLIMTFFVFTGGATWRMAKPPLFSYKEQIMGIYLVEDTILEGKEKLESELNPGVLFENTMLPYDKDTNTLYIPQSLDKDEWIGSLSTELKDPDDNMFYLCSPIDGMWNDKNSAIRGNYGYCLWLVSEKYYYEMALVVTGTPIMAIHTERREEVELPAYEEDPDTFVFGVNEFFYGNIVVFDPDISGESYMITETKVSYHERGGGSRITDKDAYNINILDMQENAMNVSLLGMREDDSWKLNALYSDPNRVRDITASQIWEKINNADNAVEEPGPTMRYVELIMDDQYQGLYCLMEPIDRKTLKLSAQDVLYKMINWNIPDADAIQQSIDMHWNVQQPIRLRYPKVILSYEEAWKPIQEYLSLFYWTEETDYGQALEFVDLDNLIDYSLFLMAVSASDNSYHNTYYAAYYEDGKYTMLALPWDLDQTFGNGLWTAKRDKVEFSPDVTKIYVQNALLRLYEAAPQDVGPLVWERWSEYRKSFLSMEAVYELFTENRDYLVETGAAERESLRWPESKVSTDISPILEFQRERMEWLDEYFYSWSE